MCECPINWDFPTLEQFVENNYWWNAKDAIGDIRLYINKSKISKGEEDFKNGRISTNEEVMNRIENHFNETK